MFYDLKKCNMAILNLKLMYDKRPFNLGTSLSNK